MFPILHRVGPFLIYSYTAVLSFGILVASGITGWLARKQQIEQWFDAVLVCLVCGLIGGRLGFVVANWDYFQERITAVPRLWQGGSSYFGALFAAFLGLWLWATLLDRKRRLRQAQSTQLRQAQSSFSTYLDLLASGFALLCAFGWLACWFEGCAYGLETTIGIFAADLPDEFGIFAVRYQTQMMGMIWSFFSFALVMITRKVWRPGQLFWLTLGLLSLGNLCISLLRNDPMPIIESVRLDLIINGTIVLISAFFMLYYQKLNSKS